MNLQKTLLLDLDGVLVDMVVPLMRWWGVRIESEENYPQQFGWDVKDAIVFRLEQQGQAYKACDLRNMTNTEFWHSPPYSFWRELQPYPKALSLVKSLENCAFDIYITTAHANPDCAAAKLDWIDEHLPKYWDRVLIGHPKHLTATPYSILIDDRTKNCEDFTKAGGSSILCPRPWNKRWAECLNRQATYDNTIIRNLHMMEGRA